MSINYSTLRNEVIKLREEIPERLAQVDSGRIHLKAAILRALGGPGDSAVSYTTLQSSTEEGDPNNVATWNDPRSYDDAFEILFSLGAPSTIYRFPFAVKWTEYRGDLSLKFGTSVVTIAHEYEFDEDALAVAGANIVRAIHEQLSTRFSF